MQWHVTDSVSGTTQARVKRSYNRFNAVQHPFVDLLIIDKMPRNLKIAGSGMRTAKSWSQAFAEAIKWLTGQIPQMRAIKDGISLKGLP